MNTEQQLNCLNACYMKWNNRFHRIAPKKDLSLSNESQMKTAFPTI